MDSFFSVLNPGILFFLLGFGAILLGSNLAIPSSVVTFISLYLMLSIGFKGGVSLHASPILGDGLLIIAIIMLSSAIVPIYSYLIFRKSQGAADAAAIGGTYGSNSTLTYITAAGFLTSASIPFGGYMTVALVLMETPAILFAIILARVEAHAGEKGKSTRAMIAEALTDGTMLLMIGSMIIGYLLAALGTDDSPMSSFIGGDMFTGMLVFFLLYMGTVVGHKFKQLESFPLPLVAFAILAPIFNGLAAIGISYIFKFQPGDALLMTILCSSASYIVAPTLLKDALPEANPAKYLTMSLGITFPLNIVIGIPTYWWIIEKLQSF